MASGILFGDGLDHLSDGQYFPTKWSAGQFNLIGSSYRRGGVGKGGHHLDTTSIQKIFPATYDHTVLQLAMKQSTGFPSSNSDLFRFYTNTGNNLQLSIQMTATRGLRVMRGSTELGRTAPMLFTRSVYHYLEVRTKFDASTGAVEIKLDGNQVLNLTNQDTEDDGTFSDIDSFWIGGGGFSQERDFDDILFRDWSVNSSFIGDQVVRGLMPNGAGSNTQYTPSAGSNYQNVDEIGPDDDTTHNESSTVGHKDSYAMDNHGITAGTVQAILSNHRWRKTDGATRQQRALVRHSGSESTGSTITMASSYNEHQHVFDNVPGGTGWTLAQVDAHEMGMEVVA